MTTTNTNSSGSVDMTIDGSSQPGQMVTPQFTMVFPQLFEPKAFMREGRPTGEPKYGLTMLFDPDQVIDMKRHAAGVARAKWGDGVDLKTLRFPFKSGDAEAKRASDKKKDGSFYTGKVVVKASSKYQPPVVDQAGNDLINHGKVYSGCLGYAELNFVAYDGVGGGNPGVTAYVNFVMVSGDGPRIAGRNASDVFAGIRSQHTEDDGTGLDDDIPF